MNQADCLFGGIPGAGYFEGGDVHIYASFIVVYLLCTVAGMRSFIGGKYPEEYGLLISIAWKTVNRKAAFSSSLRFAP